MVTSKVFVVLYFVYLDTILMFTQEATPTAELPQEVIPLKKSYNIMKMLPGVIELTTKTSMSTKKHDISTKPKTSIHTEKKPVDQLSLLNETFLEVKKVIQRAFKDTIEKPTTTSEMWLLPVFASNVTETIPTNATELDFLEKIEQILNNTYEDDTHSSLILDSSTNNLVTEKTKPTKLTEQVTPYTGVSFPMEELYGNDLPIDQNIFKKSDNQLTPIRINRWKDNTTTPTLFELKLFYGDATQQPQDSYDDYTIIALLKELNNNLSMQSSMRIFPAESTEYDGKPRNQTIVEETAPRFEKVQNTESSAIKDRRSTTQTSLINSLDDNNNATVPIALRREPKTIISIPNTLEIFPIQKNDFGSFVRLEDTSIGSTKAKYTQLSTIKDNISKRSTNPALFVNSPDDYEDVNAPITKLKEHKKIVPTQNSLEIFPIQNREYIGRVLPLEETTPKISTSLEIKDRIIKFSTPPDLFVNSVDDYDDFTTTPKIYTEPKKSESTRNPSHIFSIHRRRKLERFRKKNLQTATSLSHGRDKYEPITDRHVILKVPLNLLQSLKDILPPKVVGPVPNTTPNNRYNPDGISHTVNVMTVPNFDYIDQQEHKKIGITFGIEDLIDKQSNTPFPDSEETSTITLSEVSEIAVTDKNLKNIVSRTESNRPNLKIIGNTRSIGEVHRVLSEALRKYNIIKLPSVNSNSKFLALSKNKSVTGHVDKVLSNILNKYSTEAVSLAQGLESTTPHEEIKSLTLRNHILKYRYRPTTPEDVDPSEDTLQNNLNNDYIKNNMRYRYRPTHLVTTEETLQSNLYNDGLRHRFRSTTPTDVDATESILQSNLYNEDIKNNLRYRYRLTTRTDLETTESTLQSNLYNDDLKHKINYRYRLTTPIDVDTPDYILEKNPFKEDNIMKKLRYGYHPATVVGFETTEATFQSNLYNDDVKYKIKYRYRPTTPIDIDATESTLQNYIYNDDVRHKLKYRYRPTTPKDVDETESTLQNYLYNDDVRHKLKYRYRPTTPKDVDETESTLQNYLYNDDVRHKLNYRYRPTTSKDVDETKSTLQNYLSDDDVRHKLNYRYRPTTAIDIDTTESTLQNNLYEDDIKHKIKYRYRPTTPKDVDATESTLQNDLNNEDVKYKIKYRYRPTTPIDVHATESKLQNNQNNLYDDDIKNKVRYRYHPTTPVDLVTEATLQNNDTMKNIPPNNLNTTSSQTEQVESSTATDIYPAPFRREYTMPIVYSIPIKPFKLVVDPLRKITTPPNDYKDKKSVYTTTSESNNVLYDSSYAEQTNAPFISPDTLVHEIYTVATANTNETIIDSLYVINNNFSTPVEGSTINIQTDDRRNDNESLYTTYTNLHNISLVTTDLTPLERNETSSIEYATNVRNTMKIENMNETQFNTAPSSIEINSKADDDRVKMPSIIRTYLVFLNKNLNDTSGMFSMSSKDQHNNNESMYRRYLIFLNNTLLNETLSMASQDNKNYKQSVFKNYLVFLNNTFLNRTLYVASKDHKNYKQSAYRKYLVFLNSSFLNGTLSMSSNNYQNDNQSLFRTHLVFINGDHTTRLNDSNVTFLSNNYNDISAYRNYLVLPNHTFSRREETFRTQTTPDVFFDDIAKTNFEDLERMFRIVNNTSLNNTISSRLDIRTDIKTQYMNNTQEFLDRIGRIRTLNTILLAIKNSSAYSNGSTSNASTSMLTAKEPFKSKYLKQGYPMRTNILAFDAKNRSKSNMRLIPLLYPNKLPYYNITIKRNLQRPNRTLLTYNRPIKIPTSTHLEPLESTLNSTINIKGAQKMQDRASSSDLITSYMAPSTTVNASYKDTSSTHLKPSKSTLYSTLAAKIKSAHTTQAIERASSSDLIKSYTTPSETLNSSYKDTSSTHLELPKSTLYSTLAAKIKSAHTTQGIERASSSNFIESYTLPSKTINASYKNTSSTHLKPPKSTLYSTLAAKVNNARTTQDIHRTSTSDLIGSYTTPVKTLNASYKNTFFSHLKRPKSTLYSTLAAKVNNARTTQDIQRTSTSNVIESYTTPPTTLSASSTQIEYPSSPTTPYMFYNALTTPMDSLPKMPFIQKNVFLISNFMESSSRTTDTSKDIFSTITTIEGNGNNIVDIQEDSNNSVPILQKYVNGTRDKFLEKPNTTKPPPKDNHNTTIVTIKEDRHSPEAIIKENRNTTIASSQNDQNSTVATSKFRNGTVTTLPKHSKSTEATKQATSTLQTIVNLYEEGESRKEIVEANTTPYILPYTNHRKAGSPMTQTEFLKEMGSKPQYANNTCGIDNSQISGVNEGDGRIETYPWLGVLFYPKGRQWLSSSVVLVSRNTVIGFALDIHTLPKSKFRQAARVALGRTCNKQRLRVLDYNYHPEYRSDSYSALVLIQLDLSFVQHELRPICSPPERLTEPVIHAMVLSEDCQNPTIRIYEMIHVPREQCKKYYRKAGLDIQSIWPKNTACGRARWGGRCVWRSGTALVVKQNGRWHLLGFGVHGPGCQAPARFIDYGMYRRWVADSVARIGRPAITRLGPNHLVLRRMTNRIQRFGPCDPDEMQYEMFTDITSVEPVSSVDHQAGKVRYNLTIFANMDYSCVIFRAFHTHKRWQSTKPLVSIRRYCPSKMPICYGSGLTQIDIYMEIIYFHGITYKVAAYGRETTVISPKQVTRYANLKRKLPSIPWPASKTTSTTTDKPPPYLEFNYSNQSKVFK